MTQPIMPPADELVQDCSYCESRHEPRYLCDPAKKILDAMKERGMSFNMPTIEFPEPVESLAVTSALGMSPADQLVMQMVVKAGTLPVAGVVRPVVVFTGRTPYGVLPNWIYAAPAAELGQLATLVKDMTDLAIRTARAQR